MVLACNYSRSRLEFKILVIITSVELELLVKHWQRMAIPGFF